jgi:hypothetical protein
VAVLWLLSFQTPTTLLSPSFPAALSTALHEEQTFPTWLCVAEQSLYIASLLYLLQAQISLTAAWQTLPSAVDSAVLQFQVALE